MTTPGDRTPSPRPIPDYDSTAPPQPETVKTTSEETSAISASLTSRRRKSSVYNTLSGRKSAVKAKYRQYAHRKGVELDEDGEREELERLERVATAEIEAYKKNLAGEVKVLRAGQEADFDSDDDGEFGRAQQEFVWDVLFENQRGIYILGKAYFSSQTLLPRDPSAFTVPSHSLPSASSMAISEPSSSSPSRATRPVQNASSNPGQPIDRPIKTLYNLETFQTPSPAWEWITPWMINMRTNADEAGWRYNAWFKRGGWSSHAGLLGWAGWVRRREWVRLRCVRPTSQRLKSPREMAEQIEENGGEVAAAIEENQDGLAYVLSSEDTDQNANRLLKVMAKLPLDREKMDTWKQWLDTGDQTSLRKLQKLLDDERAVDTLSRSFTHHKSVPGLLELFREHDLTLSSTPSTPLQSPHTATSRQPSASPPGVQPSKLAL
ncbi:hypothetical protein BCR39DRAFT_230819 [Naematelia encephala]|uniref:Peroxin domain-containing protein n=1 Tax=Naematelia encephala TaxID=71784 RepID=A0A1Y2BH87_9TREE|nr:hypothetical protein BCR39DRAFT_230819 [Naematelia encephala]